MPFDSLYWLLILLVVGLVVLARRHMRRVYRRWVAAPNDCALTGAEVAQRLLTHLHISNVRVARTSGLLTDNYATRTRVLSLSPDVYGRASVAALGVVAHECGHVAQAARHWWPLRLRPVVGPLALVGPPLGLWSMLVGWLLQVPMAITVGWGLCALVVPCTLVTFPIEWDASRQARRLLRETGLASADEFAGIERVLRAAQLTYMVAGAQSLVMLFAYLQRALAEDQAPSAVPTDAPPAPPGSHSTTE